MLEFICILAAAYKLYIHFKRTQRVCCSHTFGTAVREILDNKEGKHTQRKVLMYIDAITDTLITLFSPVALVMLLAKWLQVAYACIISVIYEHE